MELIKRELEQSLKRAMKTLHNPLNNLAQGLNHKLELSQKFFLGNNVDCGQQQDNISANNISYNRLKHMGFYNASFIINCFTYILFNLNLFFLEQKFENEYDGERVRMIWTYLVRNEFYIFICKHDNFNVLNKL